VKPLASFSRQPGRARSRPSWRWGVAVLAGYLVLTGSSLPPAAGRSAAEPVPGRAHGIAVDGRVATTADVRSDVRHG
jgi:hypothetical protein